jgi:hypothetical protein
MHPTYNDFVFINCPFDTHYTKNFEAIVFSVYRCGFFPVSALSEDNALDNRLYKIEKLIENCRFGIHDISRTELNAQGFPRFNMPFELGIFFGAKRYGKKEQTKKNALIFERTKLTYLNYFSDLRGVDIKAHDDNPLTIIYQIRDWLRTSSKRTSIPGHVKLKNDFENFQSQMPVILSKLGLQREMLTFNDLCIISEEFIKTILQ